MPAAKLTKKSPLLGKVKFDNKLLLILIAAVIAICGVIYFMATRAATNTSLQPVARLTLNNKRLYTISQAESKQAQSNGWKLESANYFYAMPNSYSSWTTPVYRLSHSSGDFLFTTSQSEVSSAQGGGWHLDGPAFYVGNSTSYAAQPVYRMFHPAFGHFYTISTAERDLAVSNGWTYEGIAFYSASNNGKGAGTPTPTVTPKTPTPTPTTATQKAKVTFKVNGLPSSKSVTFKAQKSVGSCGTSFSVNKNEKICTSSANIGSPTSPISFTYPLSVTISGKTYSAYEVCYGVGSPEGGRGGCMNTDNGNPPTGSSTIYDAANDSEWHSMSVTYR